MTRVYNIFVVYKRVGSIHVVGIYNECIAQLKGRFKPPQEQKSFKYPPKTFRDRTSYMVVVVNTSLSLYIYMYTVVKGGNIIGD